MESQSQVLTRDQVPVAETWDLTTIYASDDAWTSDLETAKDLLAKAAGHRGHLSESAGRLKAALDDSLALRLRVETLYVYAKLRLDEDVAISESNARIDRVTAFSIEAGQALAFFDPEVLSMPADKLRAFVESPELSSYRHVLEDLLRHQPHVRSIEIEELLAQTADLARAPREAFGAFDGADIDFGTIEGEDGGSIALTKGRYQAIMESKNREFRQRAWERVFKTYSAHKHTLGSLHAASVRKDVFYARTRGHESARDAALFDYNIPGSVYDNLISTTREAKPVIERYHALRRRALGLDSLAMSDLQVPLAAQVDKTFSWDEAIDIVLDGVALLGDEYKRDLAAGLRGRWVDVRETKGKRSGAYSWGAYRRPPVILMNWNGTLDHVFTLAHEAGHAMHSFYADRAQSYQDAQYSIFLAEIASTINEVLLTWKLLEYTPESDVKGRFAILNRLADTISGTHIRQVQFAEFEARSHALADSGQPITLDALNEIYRDVFDAYLPGVESNPLTEIGWCRVPHFYSAFYVYQYATGISAAISLSRRIRDEGAPAIERYLDMLRAGGKDYPLNILREAGVDLTSPEPIRASLAEFDATIAELEKLADRGAFEA